MNRQEMDREWRKELDFLSDINIPGALEWADENVPNARGYIEEVYSDAVKAIAHEDKQAFKASVERYTKAWLRLWQKMALDHFNNNDIMDVDLRYYRHLPDGYSMTWSSELLDCKLVVFPRKPAKPPKNIRWLTAGELIKIQENPIILKIMKVFDGWFDRNGDRVKNIIERATQEEKKDPPEAKLKFHRKDKHNVHWYK